MIDQIHLIFRMRSVAVLALGESIIHYIWEAVEQRDRSKAFQMTYSTRNPRCDRSPIYEKYLTWIMT